MLDNADHTEPDWSELGTEYLENVPTTMQSIPLQSSIKLPYLQRIFQKYGHDGVITFEGFEHLLESLGLGNIVIQDHSLRKHIVKGLFQDFHSDHNHGSGDNHDDSHVPDDSSTESGGHFQYGVDSSHELHDHSHESEDEHVDHDHSKHSRDSDRFEIIHNQHNHDNHEDGRNVSTEHTKGDVISEKDRSNFSETHSAVHDHQHHNNSDLQDYDLNNGGGVIDHSTHSHHNSNSTSTSNHDKPVPNLPYSDSRIADSVPRTDKDDTHDDIDTDSHSKLHERFDSEEIKDNNPKELNKRSQNNPRQSTKDSPLHLKHSREMDISSSQSKKNSQGNPPEEETVGEDQSNQSYSGLSGSGSRVITNDRSVFGANETSSDTEKDSGNRDLSASEQVNSRTVRHISHDQPRDAQRHSKRHERVFAFRKTKQKRNRKAKMTGAEERMRLKRSVNDDQVSVTTCILSVKFQTIIFTNLLTGEEQALDGTYF